MMRNEVKPMKSPLKYNNLKRKCNTLLQKLEEEKEEGIEECAEEVKEAYWEEYHYLLTNIKLTREPVSLYIDMLLEMDEYYAEFREKLEEYDFEFKDEEATKF